MDKKVLEVLKDGVWIKRVLYTADGECIEVWNSTIPAKKKKQLELYKYKVRFA